MSIVKTQKRGDRLILHGVSWEEYVRLLRAFEGRHLRLTYDRGVLEIMTLSFEHENEEYLVCRFVDVITEELNWPVQGGGSTTFKRRKHQRGLEPDGCWWITHEALVRGKKRIDLRQDPPPDLVSEIDVTKSSINRMRIHAKLGIREVWRFDGKRLEFYTLKEGKYEATEESQVFPGIRASEVLPFLTQFNHEDQTTIVKRFRTWLRQKFQQAQP